MTKQLLTHSRMQSFKTCRKKAEFEYEIGLRRDYDAKALRMGTAGHEALDMLKQGGSIEQALSIIRLQYADRPDAIEEWEWSIEQETIESLVTGWNWRWQDAPLEVLASEQSFKLPLINPATGAETPLWDVAGKIDGIILIDGRKLTLEHKFVSDPIDQDSDYWRRLQIDSQISLYTWAGRQIDHDVTGVLYDVIRKPTIRPENVPILDADGKKVVLDASGNRVFNKDGKSPRQVGDTEQGWVLQSRKMTPAEWSSKLLTDIGARPEFYFARIEIARLDDELKEMQHEVWDLQLTIREAQRTKRWFRTVSVNTCGMCPYFGLCSSRYEHTDGNVPEGFVKVENVHPELA